jgi:replication-associated recombination protein RarA
MIPATKNGLDPFVCLSALQKCIRRGMEREAMQFAVELMHSSKNFHTMTCKRLEVISHEDIDTQVNPMIVPFVATAVAQAMKWYDSDVTKLGKSRMCVGNAIRLMARAKKSREGDHFAAAIGWAAILENFVPVVPDWALDQHTTEGRRMGRGLEFFREVSTKLVPPTDDDPYIEEAYRLWALKAKQPKATGELF